MISEETASSGGSIPKYALRDLYGVLFRHKWKMILFFLAVTVTVYVRTSRVSDVYRSEAKLMVKLGRESVTLDPTVTTGQIIHVSRSCEDEVNLELEILNSRELAENVVDSIGPHIFLESPAGGLSVNGTDSKVISKTLREASAEAERPAGSSGQSHLVTRSDGRDRTVLEVMKNLDIRAQNDSSIINIAYVAESPELAQDVIATLIECYLEKHIAVHQTPGSHEFFLEQCDNLEKNLALLKDELRKLRDEYGISSLEDQRRVVSGRIADLEGQIGAAEVELAASEAKVLRFQETLADMNGVVVTTETTGFSNDAVALMQAKLNELRLKERDLLSKFAEGSQMVQMVRKEVAEAQNLLDKEIAKPGRVEVSKGVNTAYLQTQSALIVEQAALSSSQAKVENLRKQLATAREGLTALNGADLKITPLLREIGIQEVNYQTYAKNLEQGRIDRTLETKKISNIGIVQHATLPTSPLPQRKNLHLALGLLVGALGAIGIAFFFEYMDHSIRTPEDVRARLQLPVLTSIPHVRVNRICPTTNPKRLIEVSGKNQKSAPTRWEIPTKIRGHYSVFRDELLLRLNGSSKVPYVFGIIGCLPGEGVSTVAANTAAVLAQMGVGHVLLVDVNVHRPCAHQIFNTRLEPGLANILTEGHDCRGVSVSKRFQNLHILAAGAPNGSPQGILRPARFAEFIRSMKKNYRFVVLDMPAMKEALSVAKLASLCDGVVLVVEAERLRSEVLLEAKAQLLKWNTNTLGVALNKRRSPVPEWLCRML